MPKLLYFFLLLSPFVYAQQKPEDFIYLKSLAPTIQQEIRYFSNYNFIGRPVPGYRRPVCIITRSAAQALWAIEKILNKKHLGLLVYDCYRPQRAVDAFVQWSHVPEEQKMKPYFYPHIDKSQLFRLNYLAHKSAHTRGSTVDLTLIDLNNHKPLDMGTPFDFMDLLSHPNNRFVSTKQYENRMLLRTLMIRYGFRSVESEWWHFTLRNEPYTDTYFNFPVE